MNIGLGKSVILLQNERVYDDLDMFSHNGKRLMTASFVLSLEDCNVPQDILEKRLAEALAKKGRTFYYANWAQCTVVYREAI